MINFAVHSDVKAKVRRVLKKMVSVDAYQRLSVDQSSYTLSHTFFSDQFAVIGPHPPPLPQRSYILPRQTHTHTFTMHPTTAH